MTASVTEACAAARSHLAEPAGRERLLATLFAAGLCALSAVLMAGAVILGPGADFSASAAVEAPQVAPPQSGATF